MISIKECSPNWERAKEKHFKFIKPFVEERINFFVKLLVCVRFAQRHNLTNLEFEELVVEKFNLTDAGKHSTFRSRANLLLSNNLISRKTDYHLLIIPTNLKKSMPELFNHLTNLKKYLPELINFEFKRPWIQSNREIVLIYILTSNIDFLYDKIIDYDEFIDLPADAEWGSYQMLKSLNIKVCPYCNRQYTTTLFSEKNKIIRPDLDHFLPKLSKKNKLLQLSFFNLIPSCSICNRNLKHRKKIQYSRHLNPYELNINHKFMRFDYTPTLLGGANGNSEDIRISIKCDSISPSVQTKVEGNKKLFCLEEIYQTHSDIVKDLIRKKEVWDANHISLTNNTYSNLNMSKSEAYRQLFGNYFDEIDFAKRPLSKLTKDIADKLGFLK